MVCYVNSEHNIESTGNNQYIIATSFFSPFSLSLTFFFFLRQAFTYSRLVFNLTWKFWSSCHNSQVLRLQMSSLARVMNTGVDEGQGFLCARQAAYQLSYVSGPYYFWHYYFTKIASCDQSFVLIWGDIEHHSEISFQLNKYMLNLHT